MINVLKLHNIRGWHIFVGEVFGHEAQNTQSLSNGSLPQNERSLLFSSSSQDEYEEVLYILPNPSGLGKRFFSIPEEKVKFPDSKMYIGLLFPLPTAFDNPVIDVPCR